MKLRSKDSPRRLPVRQVWFLGAAVLVLLVLVNVGAARADIFHDFGIRDVQITPIGGGLYNIEVEVAVVPEVPSTQDILVQLLDVGMHPVADFLVSTVGLPGYTCCINTCAIIPGYEFPSCEGTCTTQAASRVCVYAKKKGASGVPLTPGSELVAVADPFHWHEESAVEGGMSNVFAAAVPPEGDVHPPQGDVFYDFGISDLQITSVGGGLYDVELDVAVVPEAPPVEDILVFLLVDGIHLVADTMIPTGGNLPESHCCNLTCATWPGYDVRCTDTCPPDRTSNLPRLCVYTKKTSFRSMPLPPGSQLVAITDPEFWHQETSSDAVGNNIFTATIPPPQVEPGGFVRGDMNADGSLDITDSIFLLNCLFLGGECPGCRDSADTNDDGSLDISDVLYKLGYIFLGTPPPPPPFEACGIDQTEDGLECTSFPPCSGDPTWDDESYLDFLVDPVDPWGISPAEMDAMEMQGWVFVSTQEEVVLTVQFYNEEVGMYNRTGTVPLGSLIGLNPVEEWGVVAICRNRIESDWRTLVRLMNS